MRAVLDSAGREKRDVVYARLEKQYGGDDTGPPPSPPRLRARAVTRPEDGATNTTPPQKRKKRTPNAQPGDDHILARRANALEVMNALADRRDAQRELTGEIEQAELEALITRAIDIQAPKGDEWHDEGRAEDLKAYAAAEKATPSAAAATSARQHTT